MNVINQNIAPPQSDETVVFLGTASAETKGADGIVEPIGPGGLNMPGISEE